MKRGGDHERRRGGDGGRSSRKIGIRDEGEKMRSGRKRKGIEDMRRSTEE
jgi:hypothetical protein